MQGLIHNLPFTQYASLHGLSASAIKAGRTSMKHMRQAITGHSEPSSAMQKGTLIHSLFFDADFWANVCINDDSRKTNAFKALEAECEINGKTVLTTKQSNELEAIESSLRSNKDAVDLLNRCQFEVSAQWERSDVGQCKCRFDALADDGSFFIDLKTCSDIDPQAIGRQFVNMGYDIQYGWYRNCITHLQNKWPKVYQFNLETSAPYDFTIDEVYPESCDEGLIKAIEIATKYRECERTGEFTGVRSYIAKMELPSWYIERLDLSASLPLGLLDE